MINQNEWTCYIYKCVDKITKKGIPYWLATIKIPKRVNGYYTYKKKDGTVIRHSEMWNDVNFYTDLPLEPNDKLMISEFTIQKYLKKNNEFDKGEWRVTMSIFSFKNETQGYIVESNRGKKRRKSAKYKVVGKATQGQESDLPEISDLPQLEEKPKPKPKPKATQSNNTDDGIVPFIIE